MKEIFKNIFEDFWSYGLPEVLQRELVIPLETARVVLLTGVRRCGKTFLLYEGIRQLLKQGIERKNIIYLSFADERLDCHVDELDQILDAHLELYPNLKVSDLHFFFDDIQNIQNWEWFIKRLYEQASQNIYISGSNSRFTIHEIENQLKGRCINLELFPLSWKEFCHFHNINTKDKSTVNLARLERHFNTFFKQGGFPELHQTPTRYQRQKLSQLVSLNLYSELIERYPIKNTSYLKPFLNKIFQNHSNPTSIHQLFNDIKALGFKSSKDSTYQLIEQLCDIHLLYSCQKYDKDIAKSEKAEKKFYAVDHSLLDLYDFNNTDREIKLECLVYLEIRKRTEYIWYFKQQYQIDFIGKWQGSWNVIQVCWELTNNETIKREIKALTKACHKLGVMHGYIITRSTNELITMDDIEIHIMSVTHFLESHSLFSRN
jgi:predicted AAA+ superfamily ATPase